MRTINEMRLCDSLKKKKAIKTTKLDRAIEPPIAAILAKGASACV
jgi:hypothetical protein